MPILLIVATLVTGLAMFCAAVRTLSLLDVDDTALEDPGPESRNAQDEEPRTTRLGRPIETIRLSA